MKVLKKLRRLWVIDVKDKLQLSAKEQQDMEEEETKVTALCSDGNERGGINGDC